MHDKPFELLLKFALKRKTDKIGGGWLDDSEFNFPENISRICSQDNLNIDRVKLFENHNKLYRLQMEPENIVINKQELYDYPNLKKIFDQYDPVS